MQTQAEVRFFIEKSNILWFNLFQINKMVSLGIRRIDSMFCAFYFLRDVLEVTRIDLLFRMLISVINFPFAIQVRLDFVNNSDFWHIGLEKNMLSFQVLQ